MRKKLLLLVWIAAPAMAQTDPSEFLLQIRVKVLHALDRLPRYMCTQTINRSQYEPDCYAFAKNCDDLDLGRDTSWKLLHHVRPASAGRGSRRTARDVLVGGRETVWRSKPVRYRKGRKHILWIFPGLERRRLPAAFGDAPAHQRPERNGIRKLDRVLGVS
jgi:hypothetical protein